MKLKEGLEIIKVKKFSIFVYKDGEFTYEIIDMEREDHGRLKTAKYSEAQIKEIIPSHFDVANIVIDITSQ